MRLNFGDQLHAP